MSSSEPQMSEPEPTESSDSSGASNITDEAVLPKVQPPTAGFIFQLFIIPGLIVCIIVFIWLIMNWLARDSSDPREYLQKIQNNSGDQLYSARALAEVLNNSKNNELLYDVAFAKELGDVLQEKVKSKGTDQTSVSIRSFLCLAAARFHISKPLPALISAADADQEENLDIRIVAFKSILVLSENVRSPLTKDLLPSVRKICDQLAKDLDQTKHQNIIDKLQSLSQRAKRLSYQFMQEKDFSTACKTLADDLDKTLALLTSTTTKLEEENQNLIKQYIAKIRDQAEQAKAFQWDNNAELAHVIKQAATTTNEEYDDNGAELRAIAAFVLPMIPGEESTKLLMALLDDGKQSVSFNAAAAMARTGNLNSTEVLIEMLDPDMDQFEFKSEAFTKKDQDISIDFQRSEKRNRIIMNSLNSIKTLSELNPSNRLSDCQQALETLLSTKESLKAKTRVTAKELLELLKKR